MLRVGLTGGIACGKTVVAEMMREFGCVILNADGMAHRLIEPGGAAFESVVREFGGGILDGEGHIVRAKLAEIVFADPPRLAKLIGWCWSGARPNNNWPGWSTGAAWAGAA